MKTGILDRQQFDQWDGVSEPSSYLVGVYSNDIVVINDNAIEKANPPDWTYIRCHWKSELKEELAYFFDAIRRLSLEHGKVRFVFGFDS